MWTRRGAVALTAALVLTSTAACGGDGMSAKEWMTAVCDSNAQVQNQIREIARKAPTGKAADDLKAVKAWAISLFDVLSAGADGIGEEIRKLGPPGIENGAKVQQAFLDRLDASSSAAFSAKEELKGLKRSQDVMKDVTKAFAKYREYAQPVGDPEAAKSAELQEAAKEIPSCQGTL